MARNVLSFGDVQAFAAFCSAHKLDSGNPENVKKWKLSLVSSDGNASTGKRGRQKGAKTRAFIYDGEGNVLGHADCLDNDAGRMGLGASALQTHGANIAAISFTRSYVGEKPRLVEILTEDGQLVRGYAVARTINARTGEESVPESDDSEGDEQVIAE